MMPTTSLTLWVMHGEYLYCRLPGDAALPGWALAALVKPGAFASVTRTPAELSFVVPTDPAPPAEDGIVVSDPWRGLAVVGPLDFALTGVLAGLSAALAEAGISICAIATYDTDILLVPADRLADAIMALRGAGYGVEDASG